MNMPLDEITLKMQKLECHQPFLIRFKNGQIFLRLEDRICALLDSTNITNAFDLLFKTFWVFNIKYPKEVEYLYYFLEMIFHIDHKRKPILAELDNELLSLHPEKEK